MKYIIDMPEIKRCVDCDFDSYEDGKHFCSIEQSINLREINTIENIHKDCPLKPFKVKELEWKVMFEDKGADDILYQARGLDCVYSIRCYNGIIHYGKMDEIYKTTTIFDEAKSFCQQHYENMILSALED